ncbi:hypothetical protein ACN38_g10854 [Penicillium nordicum]|uniref:Uncharacterized protein n=1 Tax=Penicillium nordicum TaxID=229535 RepID=A0A0M8NZR6_9EURO|nr:hypothetical protein ACN38_g10854 [Penicillium nordicum]
MTLEYLYRANRQLQYALTVWRTEHPRQGQQRFDARWEEKKKEHAYVSSEVSLPLGGLRATKYAIRHITLSLVITSPPSSLLFYLYT